MEFKEIQGYILKNARRYSKKHGLKIDEGFAVMKLYEEVGEFAQAYLIYKNKCRPSKCLLPQEAKKALSHELADIINMVMIIADILKVDLEKALNEKQIKKVK